MASAILSAHSETLSSRPPFINLTPSLSPPLPPDPPPPPSLLPKPNPSPTLQSKPPLPRSSTDSPSALPAQVWSSLFNNLPRNAGIYKPIQMSPSFSEEAMVPPASVLAAGEDVWRNYVVGFFLDKPLSYTYVIEFLKRRWRLKGKISVKSDGTLFLFQFTDDDDRDKIIRGYPILMKNKMFIIKQWDLSISNVSGSISTVPIWVKFTNIPIFSWSHLGINWLANRIGKLVCLDESTELLQRMQFAKCLIEITPNEELVHSFPVQNPDGSKQYINVEYLWKPDICTRCKVFGHSTINCPLLSKGTDGKQVDKVNEQNPVALKCSMSSLPPSGNFNIQPSASLIQAWKEKDRTKGKKRMVQNVDKKKSDDISMDKITSSPQVQKINNHQHSSSHLEKKGKTTLLNYFSILEPVVEEERNEVLRNNGKKTSDVNNIVDGEGKSGCGKEKMSDNNVLPLHRVIENSDENIHTETGTENHNEDRSKDKSMNDNMDIMSGDENDNVESDGDVRKQKDKCSQLHHPGFADLFVDQRLKEKNENSIGSVKAKSQDSVSVVGRTISEDLQVLDDAENNSVVQGDKLYIEPMPANMPADMHKSLLSETSIFHIANNSIFASPISTVPTLLPSSVSASNAKHLNHLDNTCSYDVCDFIKEKKKSSKKKHPVLTIDCSKDGTKYRITKRKKSSISSLVVDKEDNSDLFPESTPLSSLRRTRRMGKKSA